jgi:stalled ribosome rescue protein Dom34
MKKSDQINQIGVWMDHASARLIHLNGTIEEIKSKKEHRIAGESGDGTRLGNNRSTNNEVHKHNREINKLQDFFENIYESIKSYDEIIVFGPSTAPSEFYNYLINNKKNHRGRISVEKSDYMTDNQLTEFVSNHFLLSEN